MIIGIPREIKTGETRVGAIPSTVSALSGKGHRVLVEQGAGCHSGFSDKAYQVAGAEILPRASEVWERAQMVVKVKEPQVSEYPFFRPDLLIFTFFHFAALPEMTARLVETGVTAVAYELVEDRGQLVVLAPMSEIAGRMSAQIGAHWLEKTQGGRGILLSGASGVAPARAVVIGAGTVGTNAARIMAGLGARVTMMDINTRRLRDHETTLTFPCSYRYADRENILEETEAADLVIGAVLASGAAAPKVLPEEGVKRMRPGSVLVDVAIDQGGCFETSRPTSYQDPVYVKHGVIHYCVPNIPAAVPLTATCALNYATFQYTTALAETGGDLGAVLRSDSFDLNRPDERLRAGLKAATAIHRGKILRLEISNLTGTKQGGKNV